MIPKSLNGNCPFNSGFVDRVIDQLSEPQLNILRVTSAILVLKLRGIQRTLTSRKSCDSSSGTLNSESMLSLCCKMATKLGGKRVFLGVGGIWLNTCSLQLPYCVLYYMHVLMSEVVKSLLL